MKTNACIRILFFTFCLLLPVAAGTAGKPASTSLILKSADAMDNTMVNGNLISELDGHVVFEYDDAVVRSDYAKWWRSEGIVDFSRNVVLTRPEQTLHADRMRYERDKKLCTAEGNILFVDAGKRSRLTSRQGMYNLQTRYFQAQGDPRLVQRDSLGADSLSINGKTMTYTDSTKCATVLEQVVIRKADLNARCERAHYFSRAQRADLRVNPYITYKANTLTGDSVDLIFTGDTLRGVSVQGNSNGHYRESSDNDTLLTTLTGDSMYMSMTDSGAVDSIRVFRNALGRYYNIKTDGQVNEASGKIMLLMFNKQGDVDQAKVWGNAKSTYYVDDEDGSGKNIATGDTINVTFDQGKARRVRIAGSVRGSYVPLSADTTATKKK